MKILSDYYEIICVSLAGVFAFLASIFRAGGLSRGTMRLILTDACLCAMIGSSLAEFLIVIYAMPYQLAMPVGTVVGIIGKNVFIGFFRGLIFMVSEKHNIDLDKHQDVHNDKQ